MDNVTLPRSFGDTTPAEQMKPIPRRRKSSSSQRSPILEHSQAQNTYNTITPEQHNTPSERDDSPDQGSEHEETPPQRWIGRRIWDGILQWERDNLELVLENKQSVARDHLANERTYLAWLRTSLSFASIGVAITQLFRLSSTIQPGQPPGGYSELRRLGRPLGATFIGIAVLVLLLGVQRYFTSQYWMTQGKFPASRGAVMTISAIAALITIAAFVIVIVLDPDISS